MHFMSFVFFAKIFKIFGVEKGLFFCFFYDYLYSTKSPKIL